MKQENAYRVWLWIFVGIVLVAAVAAMVRLVKNSDPGINGGTASASVLASIGADDWIKGNASSTVTLTEYGDFQCPACAAYHTAVKQLEKEFGDQVRFVFKHFPLAQHANARISALAAEAAGKQGKFWEMHDMLYENQDEWSAKSTSKAEEIFKGYAQKIGIDLPLFAEDLKSKVSSVKISRSYDDGIRFGVNSTPTFFLNNEKLPTPKNFAEFRTSVLNAVANAPKNN